MHCSCLFSRSRCRLCPTSELTHRGTTGKGCTLRAPPQKNAHKQASEDSFTQGEHAASEIGKLCWQQLAMLIVKRPQGYGMDTDKACMRGGWLAVQVP